MTCFLLTRPLPPVLRLDILSVAYCLATIGWAQTASSQTRSFHVGYSHSWGANSVTICVADTCGKGTESTNQGLSAFAGAFALRHRLKSPLRFETGLFLTRKGWAVTGPTLQTVYAEIPAVVQVGRWPDTSGVGYSIGAGAAVDLGLPKLAHSHVAAMLTAEFLAKAVEGPLWSLGIRYAAGITTVYGLHVRALTLYLGVSP